MEVGGDGGCGAVQEFDGRVGVGQDLLGPCDPPVPDLDRSEVDGGVGVGRKGGAVLGGRQALDLLQAFAINPIDIAGALAEMGDRERAVLAVIGHDLAREAREHVAVGVIGEVGGDPAHRDSPRRVVGGQGAAWS